MLPFTRKLWKARQGQLEISTGDVLRHLLFEKYEDLALGWKDWLNWLGLLFGVSQSPQLEEEQKPQLVKNRVFPSAVLLVLRPGYVVGLSSGKVCAGWGFWVPWGQLGPRPWALAPGPSIITYERDQLHSRL